MYPRVTTLKTMFASFFPQFKARVVRDEDAWQIADTTHLLWTDDAINLKRQGEYIEACKIYFDQVLRRGAITSAWASGILKTLAAAGDISDAVAFGFEWYASYADKSQLNSDKIVMHLGNLLTLIKNPNNPIMSFPAYLKSISGSPNYTVDMNQTDLYTDPMLLSIRNNS